MLHPGELVLSSLACTNVASSSYITIRKTTSTITSIVCTNLKYEYNYECMSLIVSPSDSVIVNTSVSTECFKSNSSTVY